jgi:RND family efflux transporter MFP subunit
MKQKIILAAVFLVGLVLVLIWVGGGFHSKVPGGRTHDTTQKGTKPKTLKLEMARVPGEVTVSGTVISREIARIASKVQGNVLEIKVDAGDSVKKGDLLLRLDSKELAERKAQAKAALVAATADQERAKGDFERFQSLFEKQSISKKQFDDVTAAYDVAKATKERAKAALDEAETMFSYTEITAPFDGIVGERAINVGDLVTPGRFLLSVYRPETAELQAPVPEQYATYLKEGSNVTAEVPSLGLKQETKIREIVPQRDERSRTIQVKVILKDAPGLAPGLFGKLTFPTKISQVILIPRSAVKTVGQLETVRVLDNGKIKVRNVKIGRTIDDKVEVLSGLRHGEELVVE